ncbi:MAG: response regulator [Gemmatimonadaceae bacterium]
MSSGAAQAIVDASTDAIVSVDAAQRIVQFNPAAERLFGVSRADAIGHPIERFVPARDRAEHAVQIETYSRTGATRRSPVHPPTVMALKADGTEFPVEATIARTTVDGQQLLTVFVRDATQRRQAETQLQRARTMEAVAGLAAGVAHDFNNLLMVILGNLELMEMTHGDDSLVNGFGHEAKAAAERGTALARQLLAFGRKSPLPRQPVDVSAVVLRNEEALRRAAGKHCALEIIVPEEPCVVECNTPQLDQMLLNLVTNARDAMAEVGAITVRVDLIELGDADESRWPTLSAGTYVRISVSDTGAGMSEEALRRAFEPFFTTKPAGHATGLGLAAVFGIATQLGGAVDADSSPDAGSTFTVLLPQSNKPVADDSETATTHRRRGHGMVLLVDDEAAVRATIRMILAKNGYSIIEASNGKEALEVYQERRDGIDLVLSDLRMPEMDGRSLAAALRDIEPDLPILLMSGYDDSEQPSPGADEGETFVLPKPFTAPALLDAIAKRLA